jgi:hypothetical protein
MAQRISQRRPAAPGREAGHFLIPTRAEFLQTLADAANHFTGWKFLPFARYSASWVGAVFGVKTFGRDDIHRIPLHPQARANESYIVLVIHYQAGELREAASDSTAAANGWSIEATLKGYVGGAVLDGVPPACRWSVAEGTLETRVDFDNLLFVQGIAEIFSATYPTLVCTTGMGVESGAAGVRRPSPLIIPNTNGGAEVLVELETVNVRILAVDAWQMWQETLDE